MFLGSCLMLFVSLAGVQGDIPRPKIETMHQYPEFPDEPGGGGGGAGTNSYNCAWVTDCSYNKNENGKNVWYKRWCVSYTIPGQFGSHSYSNHDEENVKDWVRRNCKK